MSVPVWRSWGFAVVAALLWCALDSAARATPDSAASPSAAGDSWSTTGRACVLPLQAPEMLPNVVESLDADLRVAVAAAGFQVQPREETLAFVQEAGAAGLQCALSDEACALRVGAAAEVSAVVVATAAIVDDRIVLTSTLLDVVGQHPRRKIAHIIRLPTVDGGASLKVAIDRLVHGKGRPTPLPVTVQVLPQTAALFVDDEARPSGRVWLAPGRHVLRAELVDHVPSTSDIVVDPSGDNAPVTMTLAARPAPVLFYTGLGIAAVGVAAAATGGTIAAVQESALWQPMPINERSDRQTAGRVGLGVLYAGAAVVVAGTVLAIVGSDL